MLWELSGRGAGDSEKAQLAANCVGALLPQQNFQETGIKKSLHVYLTYKCLKLPYEKVGFGRLR